MAGSWQVTWAPPAVSQTVTETPAIATAAACLTESNIGQSMSGLPSGLSGKVLLEVPNTQSGQRFPSLVVMDLTNNQRIEIGIGSWSSFSPDGSRVFYTDDKGIHVVDLVTRNDEVLSWVNELDYRPLLSPDGQWLAFMRGNEGIHIAHLDGSGLRKIANTTAGSVLVSWMPDGKQILAATIGQWGSQVHSVDINTGESTNYFMVDMHKGGFDSASPGWQPGFFC